MARHKVDICGVNTASIKVLSNEDMNYQFKRLKEGDLNAKEELINGNLKLVLSILKKYNNRVDNLDDLFQVGCIGLIKAINNFDLSFDVKFSTYAVPMILGEIKRHLRDYNSVRVARSIKDTAYKIAKYKEEYINEYNHEPTTQEIANYLGLDEYEIALAIDSTKETLSMFEPIYNDSGDQIYLADQLYDKKDEYSLIDKISVNEALNRLKPKEKYIIDMRYRYGKTQMELSEELGISQAQISRLEKSGLDNIKKMIM